MSSNTNPNINVPFSPLLRFFCFFPAVAAAPFSRSDHARAEPWLPDPDWVPPGHPSASFRLSIIALACVSSITSQP